MYSAGGPFTKNKKRIKKFKETGDSRYIYHNELEHLIKEKYIPLLFILLGEQIQPICNL